MTTDNLQDLKKIRAEYQAKLDALDAAIQICESVIADLPANQPDNKPERTPRKQKAKATTFVSTVNLADIPDYNPHGGGIRSD